MIYPSERGTSNTLRKKTLKLLRFVPENQLQTKKDDQDEIIRSKVDKSHLLMDSFTLELVSNAPLQNLFQTKHSAPSHIFCRSN